MSREWPMERLDGRPPGDDDLLPYKGLFLNPAVSEWLRPPALEPFGDADIIGMLSGDVRHWQEHDFGPWALIDRDTGAFVGRGGLCWTEVEEKPAVELPWAIDPVRQGEGLATEAAEGAIEWARSLRLREVVTMTIPSNLASQRVAEKAGFRASGEVERKGLRHFLYRLELAG